MVSMSLIRDSRAVIFNQKRLGLFLLILCFVVLSVLSYNGLINPLLHDEAYLLQVADMLAKGEGYASYGVLKGDGPWLFSPHITVGPIVLIPLSLLWHLAEGNVIAVRAFMLVSSYLYLAGLFRLFWNEKSGLLIPVVAIASSLCVVNDKFDRSITGLVLGEVSAVAAIVWAGWAIKENRPYLAATMAGISIQIKLVFALAGSVILLAWLIPALASSERVRYRVILTVGLIYALPTLAFELWRFFSYDSVDAWLVNLDEFIHFLKTQNVSFYSNWMDTKFLYPKLTGFYSSLPAMAWIASGIALLPIFLSISIWLTQLAKRRGAPIIPAFLPIEGKFITPDRNKFPLAVSIGLGIAGLAMLAGWITQSAQLSSRQGLPFFLLFIPSVFAMGGYCCFRGSIMRRGNFVVRSMALSSFVCIVFLTVALVSRIEDILEDNKVLETRKAEQEHVVNIIRRQKAKSLFVDTNAGAGMWQDAVYQLLTPIQAIPLKTGESQIMIVSNFLRDVNQKSFSDYAQECKEILYSSSSIFVCRLPEFDKEETDIQVLDWGPMQTPLGVVPNRQSDGGGGLWIRIRDVDTKKIGPLAIYFSGESIFHRTIFTGKWVTASLPLRFFNKPGRHEVSLKQLVTGKIFHVGYFQNMKPEVASNASPPELLKIVPTETLVGVPFNVQPNGKSAIGVEGSGFNPGAQILFGDAVLPSTFGNSGWVTALVPDNLISQESTVDVAVRNPDGKTSNVRTFKVVSSGPPPELLKIVPTETLVGVPFNVQPNGKSAIGVEGSGFNPGAQILFGDAVLPSTFGNSGWVTALVPDNLISQEGTVDVAVRNPDGKTSNVRTFKVVSKE